MCTMWSQTSFSRSRSWLTISSVWRKRLRCSVSHSMASRSRWFDGSSRISRSGLLNSVPASATRMRQPPENSPQGRAWASLSKPRPCRIEAARAGAEAAPISSSRAWMSASRSPSWQASDSASSAVRSPSAASTASSTVISPPGGSCGTEPMRFRPLRLMLPPSASIWPWIRRNRVDLPAPLRPTRPTFQPSDMAADARSNSTRSPWRKERSLTCNMGPRRLARGKSPSNRLAGPKPRVYKARPLAQIPPARGFHGRRTHFLDHQAGCDPPEPDRQDQRPVRGQGPAHRGSEADLDDPHAGRAVLRRAQGAAVLQRPLHFHDVWPGGCPGAGGRGRHRQEPRHHGRHQSGQRRGGNHPQGLRRVDRGQLRARLRFARECRHRDQLLLRRLRDRRLAPFLPTSYVRWIHISRLKRPLRPRHRGGRGRGPARQRGEGEVGYGARTRNIPCLSATTSPTHCFAMGPFLSPALRRRGPRANEFGYANPTATSWAERAAETNA